VREISLAKKYSKALVDTLKNEEEFFSIKQELTVFKDLISADPGLKAGMETPMLSSEQKSELLNIISDKMQLSQKSFKFLEVVSDESRMSLFNNIYDQLDLCWYEHEGIEKIRVLTAVPMNLDEEKRLLENLEKAFNKKIVIEKEIDTSLIAGIKIVRGSVFYDFSVDGNLKKLRESLTSGLSVREN